nr:hypothetical protein [Tanacetum cinerariifolium]
MAYFDGRISKAERVPRHVNRQNHFEVPSELYREIEEQKSVVDQMLKKEAEREKTYEQMLYMTRYSFCFTNTTIKEDQGRQIAIMNLGHQFDNPRTTKDELQKAYEECKDIPMEQRALIENFLIIESELDYAMQNALFRKAAKLEKQIIDKNQWLQQL